LVLVAERVERRHVDFVERRQMRGRFLRLQQILGDALPPRRHLLARLALARRRAVTARRCDRSSWTRSYRRSFGAGRRSQDIGLGDGAPTSGAGYSGDVDAALLSDATRRR